LTTADYISKIAVLEAENAHLRTQVSRIPILEAENTTLRNQVIVLEQNFLDLSKKIDQLMVRKNSSNSSMPPSSDLFKKNQSLRTTTGLKSGGQKGHKGNTLKMVDNPDHIVPIVPVFCNVCATELDANKAVLLERRQVLDIPPIKPEITEYQVYEVVCNCGHHQVSSFPTGVDNHIQYGPNITAIAVYNNIYQTIPFKRLQNFFNHICNLPISTGTLQNMVDRTAQKARPIWEDFRRKIEQSKSVGSDETGAKVNGKKQWIWVWQNTLITFLVASKSRGYDVIAEFFPNGFPKATLGSDRWKAQLKTAALNHQLCLAHLLRELIFLEQVEKTPWATQFRELLLDAIQLKKSQNAYPKENPLVLDIEKNLQNLLQDNIIDTKASKTITFRNSMAKYQSYIFTFLYDSNVTYDNNASERSIRNVKVKLKVSGQFKSRQQQYCILRSVIDTTIKNGQSVFAAIAAIVNLQSPPKAAV
jgi:transposase